MRGRQVLGKSVLSIVISLFLLVLPAPKAMSDAGDEREASESVSIELARAFDRPEMGEVRRVAGDKLGLQPPGVVIRAKGTVGRSDPMAMRDLSTFGAASWSRLFETSLRLPSCTL